MNLFESLPVPVFSSSGGGSNVPLNTTVTTNATVNPDTNSTKTIFTVKKNIVKEQFAQRMACLFGHRTLSKTAGDYTCLSLRKTNDDTDTYKDTVQWVYVNKSKWRHGQELPTKAYVFYRQNESEGVYQHIIEFYDSLSIVYTSEAYHVLEIPSRQIATPVVILLLPKDISQAIDVRISDHVVKTCSMKGERSGVLGNDREFYALCRGLSRSDNSFDLKSLMGFFLSYMNLSTDHLLIEKTFGYDEKTKDPFQIYKHINESAAISLDMAYERVRNFISDFAFIKKNERDVVGLVTSINRIRYNKTQMIRTDTPDICLLDRLRVRVNQFVALNSPNIPGSYSEAERRFITDTAVSIKENALIFINIMNSVGSWSQRGDGLLKFTDILSYSIDKYHLKINPTTQSDEDIQFFRKIYNNVHKR